jgi:hypothetical protein
MPSKIDPTARERALRMIAGSPAGLFVGHRVGQGGGQQVGGPGDGTPLAGAGRRRRG